MTLLDLFDATRRDRFHHLAVDDVTYGELHAGSLRTAALLAARGLRRGDRLAIYCENRIGFVYAYLAALRMGAVVVPVNVLYRAAELEHVLGDAEVRLVVVSNGTREHLTSTGIATIDAADIEVHARNADAASAEDFGTPPEPDDIAAILYTSGTTGRSKGAMIAHGNFATTATQLVAGWRWQETDTLAIALPLFHTHGLSAALNGTLTAGARLIVQPRFDAAAMLDILRRDDVTMFFGVPTMYVRLLEALGTGSSPKLRLCVSGSAALSADVHDAFRERFGMEILERYGATEFGFALSNRYGGPRVAGSVGVPFPGTRVRVSHPTTRETLAPGDVGELLVSGPNVFAGYWGLPEATADAFVTDAEGTRWYTSGDLATYDPEHRVYRIVGRSKELIISGGFNIYPREIEIEIDRYPAVIASAVIGIPDAARGELPVAFVETSGALDVDGLLAALRERLASFKIPREVRVIDVLPRNAMGKIEKPKLRALL